MAKIIVTQVVGGIQHLVDTKGKFVKYGKEQPVSVTDADGKYVGAVRESIEEIQKRINEAEAQATNKKLDEILENQRKILEKLSEMDREVVSCEEF